MAMRSFDMVKFHSERNYEYLFRNVHSKLQYCRKRIFSKITRLDSLVRPHHPEGFCVTQETYYVVKVHHNGDGRVSIEGVL